MIFWWNKIKNYKRYFFLFLLGIFGSIALFNYPAHKLQNNNIPYFEKGDTCTDKFCKSSGTENIKQEAIGKDIVNRPKEFLGIEEYINTEPILLSQFVGKKVILIDFWRYSCPNCQRAIPHLVKLYSQYKDKGLEIISIHTPEFSYEKNKTNVENAVKQFGITYPVLLDNNYVTWNSYNNLYWPQQYLVGKNGLIVYSHSGEGDEELLDSVIQKALQEKDR